MLILTKQVILFVPSFKKRRSGFLLVETMIALLIFGIMSVLFWEGWESLNKNNQLIAQKLHRERAILNAKLLINRNLIFSLPQKVSENITLVSMSNQLDKDNNKIIILKLKDKNGESFFSRIKK